MNNFHASKHGHCSSLEIHVVVLQYVIVFDSRWLRGALNRSHGTHLYKKSTFLNGSCSSFLKISVNHNRGEDGWDSLLAFDAL